MIKIYTVNKSRIVYLVQLTFVLNCSSAQNIPQANISNGLVNATVYLPDFDYGYYRGTRFDWSGVMPKLEFNGHSYFGKWFETYDAKVHESVMGPVEDFEPIGYDKAKIGESFIKIGVGSLTKPLEPKYAKFKTYKISDPGEWRIKENPNSILFHHSLNKGDYPYEYEKSITLTKDKAEMVLKHKLTNTGNSTIETEVYNHNFFYLDSMNIGPGYSVKFSFKLIPEADKFVGIGEFAKIDGNSIVYTKSLKKNDHVLIKYLTGFDSDKSEYDIQIENKSSGAGVRITGDRPMSRLIFWSAEKAVCPEPYIRLKLAPEETATWKITYNFYVL